MCNGDIVIFDIKFESFGLLPDQQLRHSLFQFDYLLEIAA